MDFRKSWMGWNELPVAKEGHTGKYIRYQSKLHNIVKNRIPKHILEIGFNAGHSACCFLNASPESKLYTFDICRHGTEHIAHKVLSKYFDITLIEGNSTESVPKFFENNDIKFDLIFIDGAHYGDTPYYDMINTKNHVNKGGLIVIDDMNIKDVSKCYNKIDWSGFREIKVSNVEKKIKTLEKQ